jgi:hypothetical protein
MMVPVFIMMVPAFMVPDNRVSPSLEDLAANEKAQGIGIGGSRLSSPATPPDKRVRIRRFGGLS